MPTKEIPKELETAIQKMMDDGVPEATIQRVMTLYMDAHDTVGGQFLNELKGALENVPHDAWAALTSIPAGIAGLATDAMSLVHGETPEFTKGIMDSIVNAPQEASDWWTKFKESTHEERGQMLSPIFTGAIIGKVVPPTVGAAGRGLSRVGSALTTMSPASQEAVGVIGGGLLGASAGGPGTAIAGAASGSWAGPRMIRGLGRAATATGEMLSGEASPATAAASATAEGNAAKVANAKFKQQVKQWRDEARSMKKTEAGLAARTTAEKTAADEAARLKEAEAAKAGKTPSTTVTERVAGTDAEGRTTTKTTKFSEPKEETAAGPKLSDTDQKVQDLAAELKKSSNIAGAKTADYENMARKILAAQQPATRPAIRVQGKAAAELAAPDVPVERHTTIRVQPSKAADDIVSQMIKEGAFAGDRTTGHFTEGRGGLSDVAAGKVERIPMPPAERGDLMDEVKAMSAPKETIEQPGVGTLKMDASGSHKLVAPEPDVYDLTEGLPKGRPSASSRSPISGGRTENDVRTLQEAVLANPEATDAELLSAEEIGRKNRSALYRTSAASEAGAKSHLADIKAEMTATPKPVYSQDPFLQKLLEQIEEASALRKE